MLFPLYCNRSVWDSKDFLVVVVVGFLNWEKEILVPEMARKNGESKCCSVNAIVITDLSKWSKLFIFS